MGKRVFLIIGILALASSVYGQTFEVVEIASDLTGAVLRDRDTGRQWEVKQGDTMEGWRVFKIEAEGVTIVKPKEGSQAIVTQLPFRAIHRAVIPPSK